MYESAELLLHLAAYVFNIILITKNYLKFRKYYFILVSGGGIYKIVVFWFTLSAEHVWSRKKNFSKICGFVCTLQETHYLSATSPTD
jgi:hypothetical protein